jgi:hypothetical protein
MSNKVNRLEARVGKLEPIPPPDDDHQRWNKVVASLSPDEREAVSRVMKALEESGGCDSLETLPAEQKAAWNRMMKLYEEEKP